jgi:leucyl/phenylalanyl-tRNA---protein transferase
MPIYRLGSQPVFPDPEEAEENGLLAVGGDLSVPRLLNAYASGLFPWYGQDDPILWWSPPERALILPGEEHLSRRTLRAIKNAGFEIRVDTCFEAVVAACAEIPRSGQDSTWITLEMRAAYLELHREGFAHSFETFHGNELVGGLYGISLGAAFFGESMFSREDNASRAAFAALCERVWAWDFHFVDGQLPNDNLAQLGARVITREDFLDRLERAMKEPTRRGIWE